MCFYCYSMLTEKATKPSKYRSIESYFIKNCIISTVGWRVEGAVLSSNSINTSGYWIPLPWRTLCLLLHFCVLTCQNRRLICKAEKVRISLSELTGSFTKGRSNEQRIVTVWLFCDRHRAARNHFLSQRPWYVLILLLPVRWLLPDAPCLRRFPKSGLPPGQFCIKHFATCRRFFPLAWCTSL